MKNLFQRLNQIVIAMSLLIATTCCGEQFETIPANNKNIEYTGRIDFSDPLAPRFSYSGVSIRASFTGTGISMIMDDDTGENYYNLILNGEVIDTVKISKGKKTYKIAENLENKTHEIEIFRRTELTFGKTQFFGFIIEGGSLLPIENKRERLIEYIGNSITCGYGNEGDLSQTFIPETENHYMTYAAITSRNLNARHFAVCRSGIGIYRNFDGPETGSEDCMTNLYSRMFLYDESPLYAFEEKPDLVCINLGTNDFSVNKGDSALYVSNYFRFIDTIQSKYEKPDILLLLGSMITEPLLSNIRGYLEFIADSANSKGKGNVYFFEMSGQTGDLGIGTDYHPSVEQHKKNGAELTEFIKSIKGW